MPRKSAIAIGAHPDDIEFYMAGTLVLLKEAGYEIHYMNLASGSCGTVKYNVADTRRIRKAEGKMAAKILGATFHGSITDDLEIFYDLKHLRRVAAVIREAQPEIVLTHSPEDYMEDHMNACRLAVTAAFARGMPNFKTIPARSVGDYPTTVYHAMPHGLCDPLRRKIVPGLFINTEKAHPLKLRALAAHESQQNWLDVSQGMNSYLRAMEDASLEVGKLSKRFKHAEGWRRHLHLGFCSRDADPLALALGKLCLVNRAYENFLSQSV
jgi:LmbE family N-acetylglucosaminyl deacetylase